MASATEERIIGGKTYLVYEGTYYRAFVSDGDTIYQVVEESDRGGLGPPAGCAGPIPRVGVIRGRLGSCLHGARSELSEAPS